MSDAITPFLRVRAIPLFSDNYCWRVDNEVSRQSFVVDPAEPDKVLASYTADVDSPELVAALTTHHHWDHAGGNEALAARVRGIEIIGSVDDAPKIAACTRTVAHGDTLRVAGVDVHVLATPCHTRGHVCYFLPSTSTGSSPCVFTGDTLFCGGVGRFFEGTAEAMHEALERLKALPADTKVYCGHEYTEANLRFCVHVEPDNAATRERLAAVTHTRTRAQGVPHAEVRAEHMTVPSTLAEELATNVFLRTHEPSVQQFTHGRSGKDVCVREVLHRLREAKNGFTA